MNPRVLSCGLDTVVVSFAGQFDDGMIERLDAAKVEAQQSENPIPFPCGLYDLHMQPSAFGKWSWRLAEPRFSIVAKRNAAKRTPDLQVRISSFGLWNEDLPTLWYTISSALETLGCFRTMCVSRADVCVDFHGWTPQAAEMRNIVCPVSKRSIYGTEAQEETFKFGKRTVFRLYNKTEELKESKKTWFRDVWGQSEHYDPEESVWRAEFQADRTVLKELDIDTWEQLLANKAALMDYGLSWANLRVPTADKTKTRWPEDERWTALRGAVFGGVPLKRSVRPAELMSLKATISRFIGNAMTAGAYFEVEDFESVLISLAHAAEMHIHSEGIDFAEGVRAKKARIMSGGS